MSSRKRAPHTAPETAERIRDAAIAEFAAHGFTKTTVRRVATAAGVSPGLVIHHFGSKETLRAACDDHVFEAATEIKRENATASPSLIAEMLTDGPLGVYAEYLMKSMLDPSAQGQRFFDHYIQVIEQVIEEGFGGYTLRKAEDRRAQSTTLAMLALAPMMLEPRIRRSLGTKDLQGTMTRLVPYLFDMYRHGFIESEPEPEPEPETRSGSRARPGSQHDPPGQADPQPGSDRPAESEP